MGAHADDLEAFGLWAANRIEEMILFEGPDTVAAVFLEPVQNSGGCFPPPPGYFQRVREICDQYDVLLVSDEVICAFGRIGNMFACDAYGYVPDMITCAKAHDQRLLPDRRDDRQRPDLRAASRHGNTRVLPRLHVRRSPGLGRRSRSRTSTSSRRRASNERVRENSPAVPLRRSRSCYDLPIVGDVRGDGYFFGIELVKDKATRTTFDDDESERLSCAASSPRRCSTPGLYCRADDRGDPVIQLAPPLTIGQPEFDEIEGILRNVLDRGVDAALSSFWQDSLPAIAPTAAGDRPGRSRDADVAIIGAGLTGLLDRVLPARARPGAADRPAREGDRRVRGLRAQRRLVQRAVPGIHGRPRAAPWPRRGASRCGGR